MPLGPHRAPIDATALLVMPPGPARKQAAAALRSAGFRCRGAREPYAGTARFVEAPTDLVLLSLERFRDRDLGFVSTVRRRRPKTRILLLVPEGARRLAVRALEVGADSYLPLPFYATELAAVARRLVHGAGPAAVEPGDPKALARLATEVSHAVNNPLQVLSLMGEVEKDKQRRAALQTEVGRVRDVVDILSRFGHRAPLQKDRGLLGPLLARCVERFTAEKKLVLDGRPPADGPAFGFDADQISIALDDLIGLIVARAGAAPLSLAARVRPTGPKRSAAVEAAVRGRAFTLDAEEFESLCGAVVWSHDDTRVPHPGLALASAIAKDHGGRLTRRQTKLGTVLALELPLA